MLVFEKHELLDSWLDNGPPPRGQVGDLRIRDAWALLEKTFRRARLNIFFLGWVFMKKHVQTISFLLFFVGFSQ